MLPYFVKSSRPIIFLGSGIFHGTMNYASTSDDFIDGAQLLPYPAFKSSSRDTSGGMPVSIGLTEFHFLLLYKNRLAAVCNLNDELDFEQLLPLVSWADKHDTHP